MHGAIIKRKSKMATEDVAYAASRYYYAIHVEELFLYSKVLYSDHYKIGLHGGAMQAYVYAHMKATKAI